MNRTITMNVVRLKIVLTQMVETIQHKNLELSVISVDAHICYRYTYCC